MTHPHDWFTHARFGLFVHFGLYSVPGRHEWVMTREQTPVETYERYAQFFDPDRFDAPALARAAKEAGMRYGVLTAKHHEGFAMYDTKLSDYSSVKFFGRDIVREFVDAFRAEGLGVGLYYSLLDWHHPDYTIDGFHPLRAHPQARELNATRDWPRYREYLHGQVREILTQYGQIDYLFYDFTYDEHEGWPGKGPDDWASEELLALTRELQPGIIVGDRLGIPGDLVTPEQFQPDAPPQRDGVEVMWEACQTLNGSWGYDRDNLEFKTPDMIVRMLVDIVSKNGNLLLNVGPDGRGGIAPRDLALLAAVGEWMSVHEPAIRGAGVERTHRAPSGAAYTRRGDRLFLHLFSWPFGHLHPPGLAGRVRFARLLNDGTEIKMSEVPPEQQVVNTQFDGQPAGTLTLHLPTVRPDVLVPVIELFLEPEA